jgi:hypothetical protein
MDTPDIAGDVSLIVQIVILFILVLGLPLAKDNQNSKNLLRHGYLTAFALGFHTVLVIIVMILLAFEGFSSIFSLPTLNLVLSLSHIILGFAALGLAYVVVGFWVSKPIKSLACIRAKKLMLPLIIIWATSLVLGAILHLFELF